MANTPCNRLILAIDEFDSLLKDVEEPSAIISLVCALVTNTSLNIQLLLTMSHVPDLLSGTCLEKPVSKAITLRPFSREDMDEMILDIIGDAQPISSDELQTIYELSGGWPFYAKWLLVGMADLPAGPDQISQALEVAVKIKDVEPRIVDIYSKHFDDDEKALVLLLAECGDYLIASQLEQSGMAMQAAARRLARRGFIRIETDGGCRFRIGLLGPWFRKWTRYDLEVYRRLDDLLPRLATS
jgi:hypothetical protein